MGLLDMLGQGLQHAADSSRRRSAAIEEWAEKYQRYDTDRLLRMYRQESDYVRKMALAKVLKEREN